MQYQILLQAYNDMEKVNWKKYTKIRFDTDLKIIMLDIVKII